MSQPDIFLDTSIQTRRFLLAQPEQQRQDILFSKLAPRLCTTNYVWMEFQRTVASDHAHIRRLMLSHKNWGDVIAHLLKGQRGFRSRSAVRCTQILGQLFKDSRENLEYALRLTDQTLKYDLKIRFWTHVISLSDPISCDLVNAGIARQSDGNFAVAASCRKEAATCNLPQFLTEHCLELQTIVGYLDAHPNAIKDQTRVERLLTNVIQNPQSVLGQSTCWPLGDIIIALQVPSGAMLWTLDKRLVP